MHGRIHRGRQGVQTPSPILILIDLLALKVVILGHRAWADLKGRTSGPDHLPQLILIDLFALEVVILGHRA